MGSGVAVLATMLCLRHQLGSLPIEGTVLAWTACCLARLQGARSDGVALSCGVGYFGEVSCPRGRGDVAIFGLPAWPSSPTRPTVVVLAWGLLTWG